MSDYPPGMTLRPLVSWPHAETHSRKRSPFRSSWSDTMELLRREIRQLGGGHHFAPSVLQIALREQDFRLDGLPRAGSSPSMPGVILNVESNKGPLSFPCDKFTSWQENLRAIALGLDALRRVDRYGITPGNEQYQGWLAIESAAKTAFPTGQVALEFLAKAAGADGINPDRIRAEVYYKQARALAHPDRNDGDQTLWDQVETAGAALRAAGWI